MYRTDFQICKQKTAKYQLLKHHVANFSMILSKIFSKIPAKIPAEIVVYSGAGTGIKKPNPGIGRAPGPGFQSISEHGTATVSGF